jgi:5-(carboxyamino)imidazole ribonucleotide mutase
LHRGGDHLGFEVLYGDVDHGQECAGKIGLCNRPLCNTHDESLIGVVMGSSSDWDTMQHAVHILQQFGVAHEARVVSAHRMPDDMFAYAERPRRAACAPSSPAPAAPHLPGMLAAKTVVPVLGVPVASRHLQGVDSLHSIVQMPKGVPVATFAIGTAGAANAALFAVALLAATTRRCASGCTPSAPSRPRRRAP